MNENEIARVIIDVAYNIYVELGSGLLDSSFAQIK